MKNPHPAPEEIINHHKSFFFLKPQQTFGQQNKMLTIKCVYKSKRAEEEQQQLVLSTVTVTGHKNKELK